MANKIPVIAIFDVGKTNKKLFLFDEQYKLVFERTAKFNETVDEDGDPCENLESLRLSVFDSLREVFSKNIYDIKAISFSTYGASFVYLDEQGQPLTPLYNYLKEYPKEISDTFYKKYGGEDLVSNETASPVLGSLNSGLQLYRIKEERPELFARIKYALHLPQYMSYLLSGSPYSELTSIGCHTLLWDFNKAKYHTWVTGEGLEPKLAPLVACDTVTKPAFGGDYKVGVGLHDSSAALIPYLVNFHEPFLLISTGTWCISLNPFNNTPLTPEELKQDCLCYLSYKGNAVKASRLFAGYEHEQQTKRIAQHFKASPSFYKSITYNPVLVDVLKAKNAAGEFENRHLDNFENIEAAYHQLIIDLIEKQIVSSQLVLNGAPVSRIFVDGGFSKNPIYMNLLAKAFPKIEVYAASVAQATSVGTALSIHQHWNSKPIPNDMIELKYYAIPQV